ncbi:MAG: septation protein SepH [Nocardioides sp.]
MKDQDLTLVGLTEDKTKLVLVSDTGEKFTLPADAKLRAALQGDHARLGQLEIKMESALRPRDIQARIRAGESPESVAAAAQTSIDKIMGYATPVLAERAHIADRAQRASVRRKAGEGSSRLLGDAVAEQLRGRNVDPGTVDWDAWRREDGRWTLVADYRTGNAAKRAEFVFDAPGRYVVAEDDEARWLVGEGPAASDRPAASTPAAAPAARRLASVAADEELPLGEDAIELVTDAEPTVDLTVTARAVRSADPEPRGDDVAAGTGDADWIATQASDRPTAPAAPVAEAEPEQAEEPEPEPEPTRKPARKGRGRASVPSWDEIMFGGGKQE